MTTATIVPQRPPATIRPHRASPTILKKRPRYHENKKTANVPPVLLLNLKNRYARRRPSSSSSSCSIKAEEAVPENRKVQFFPRVRVKRIPSRFSYSESDKLSLWVPKKELKQMVMKNHAEFAFEGQDWQKAPEEDDFGQRNGKLVHPFYVWAEEVSSEESLQDDSSSDPEEEEESCEE